MEKENEVHCRKVWAVVSVARQVEGEFVCVKPEKAFLQASKADEYANALAKKYAESITTPVGVIQCICERGIIELDIEE